MKGFAVMLLLVVVYFPTDVHARCDEGSRIFSSTVTDCPAGVGLSGGRTYAPDGRRYRAIFVAYTDPATGITIYTHIVRGGRNPTQNFDAEAPRYAIDLCAYGSEGIERPIYQQIGGDKSVSVCCDHGDDGEPDDDPEPCPTPLDYPLPMRAPAGQDQELEQLALEHLVQTLTSEQYPWLNKWQPLRSALASAVMTEDQRRSAPSWLFQDREVPEGAADVVQYADGFITAAMPDADAPATPSPRTHGWKQLIAVYKGKAGGVSGSFCRMFNTACEHSGTLAIRRTSSTWWQIAWQKCNHGRCPLDGGLTPWCLFESNWGRAKHAHRVACATRYDPSGAIYGHVCNDDTELQYHAVRDNFHPNNYSTSPCYDPYRHWTATPCW